MIPTLAAAQIAAMRERPSLRPLTRTSGSEANRILIISFRLFRGLLHPTFGDFAIGDGQHVTVSVTHYRCVEFSSKKRRNRSKRLHPSMQLRWLMQPALPCDFSSAPRPQKTSRLIPGTW